LIPLIDQFPTSDHMQSHLVSATPSEHILPSLDGGRRHPPIADVVHGLSRTGESLSTIIGSAQPTYSLSDVAENTSRCGSSTPSIAASTATTPCIEDPGSDESKGEKDDDGGYSSRYDNDKHGAGYESGDDGVSLTLVSQRE
jgi:hypothetical protein